MRGVLRFQWKSRVSLARRETPALSGQGARGTHAQAADQSSSTHPGEMLLEDFLKPLNISQTDFARRISVSYPRLSELIHGKRGVTPDTALRLAQVLRLGNRSPGGNQTRARQPFAGP
jgi:addiction module HigA family antidote